MQRVSREQSKESSVPSRSGSLIERVAEQLGEHVTSEAAGVVAVPLRSEPALDPAQFDDAPRSDGQVEPKEPCRKGEVDLANLQAEGFIHPNSVRTRRLEEFRIIKRAILQSVKELRQQDQANSNVIMVTSTRPGEGKTFAAINLALTIALEPDHTVLLVDADMIMPRISETLGLEPEQGLFELLKDSSLNPSDVTIGTNIEGLSVLPGLGSNQMSTELLASRRMAQIVQQMAREDPDRIVIFDTPPVLATSEPAALAAHVGQIVFTVEAEHTSRNAIQEALDLIGPHANIGFVLNKAKRQFGSAQFGSYYVDGGKRLKEKEKRERAKS